MKKILLTLMISCAIFGVARAQLSQGDTYSSKIRTGNRPDKGDWGLYIGPSYAELLDFINWCDKSKDVDVVRGLPLINVKYYGSSNLEWRLGIQCYNKVTKHNGTIEKIGTEKSKLSETFLRFSPGVAYHFSSKNILDVYVGGMIPIGMDGEKNIYETADYKDNAKRNSFVIGVGVYGGLQAFVADLPFSIGLECGLQGLVKCGQKVKHITTDGDGNTQTYYTTLDEENQNKYSKLSSSTATFGSDFRLTFTYYFNNKKN